MVARQGQARTFLAAEKENKKLNEKMNTRVENVVTNEQTTREKSAVAGRRAHTTNTNHEN